MENGDPSRKSARHSLHRLWRQANLGHHHHRLPATGKETVLDVVASVANGPLIASGGQVWVARPNGDLPEQAQDNLLRPERYEPWVERWGEPASPLLWSHAMHLRLCHALGSDA